MALSLTNVKSPTFVVHDDEHLQAYVAAGIHKHQSKQNFVLNNQKLKGKFGWEILMSNYVGKTTKQSL